MRFALAGLAVLLCGCNYAGPLAYYLRPQEINKPEFSFPGGARVLVLCDRADRVPQMPVFDQALFEKTEHYFRKYRSKAELIPLRRVHELRRSEGPEFARMPIQTIGRRLDADYVLHLRIETLRVRLEPQHPLLAPQVVLHSKVIACDHPASDARVWPDEPRGHRVERERPHSEYGGAEEADAELARLARETAYWVTLPFFPVDLEEPPPVER